MNAKDLRIGDLVLMQGFIIEDKEKYREIIVNANDIVACQLNPSFFKPIPLTEEWLLKFGFRLHKGLVYIFKHHARINITKQFELLLDNNLWVELKYVHELQNLYFALTNKELEIK